MQLSLAPVVAFAFGYHPLLFAAILRFFVVTLRFPLSSLAFLVVILREAEDLLFSHHAAERRNRLSINKRMLLPFPAFAPAQTCQAKKCITLENS